MSGVVAPAPMKHNDDDQGKMPDDLQVPDLVILDKSEIMSMEVGGFKQTTGVSSGVVLRHNMTRRPMRIYALLCHGLFAGGVGQ